MLTKDKEFCFKRSRPYYVLEEIKYKNKIISIAIPLRSNINKKFQKNKNYYIKVKNSKHTITKKGNIAGWQIIKMVPIKRGLFYETKVKNPNLVCALKAIKNNKKEFIYKCNKMINLFEKNKNVFGSIDFDYYFKILF